VPKKVNRYRVRSINPNYYQKLAFRGKKVVAVSGYLRKKGKDKKIYERKIK
jgi:hypothetical protein